MQFDPLQPHDRDSLDASLQFGAMADDANWPAGYVALGEQLRDDAAFIADRYPAGAPPALLLALAQVLEEEPAAGSDAGAVMPANHETASPAKTSWSVASWSSLVPAMLATVALAAVAVMVTQSWWAQDGGRTVATPGKDSPAPRVAALNPPAKAPEASPAIVAPSAEGSNPMTPAMFEELSGPEREGLLDLLEHQPQEKPRLSI